MLATILNFVFAAASDGSDAGAHGAETAAHAERDRLACISAILGGGEDESHDGCEH